MAKKLQELVEAWAGIKSPADKKFAEKIHPTKETGKKPDVKTKKIDRRAHQDGYEPGEDEEVYNKTQKEEVEVVAEKAPPGKEKMVKAIKKAESADGYLSKKEKAIAYATAWKSYNKDKGDK